MRPYKFRMRLSSRRLKVTRFDKAPAASWRAAARASLGSASSEIKLMAHLLSCPVMLRDMIAPTALLRKCGVIAPCSLRRSRNLQPSAESTSQRRHGIVSSIIIPPHLRPPRALLNWDKNYLRWPGPFDTGFLSPQPPGVVGTGSIAEQLIRDWTNASWSFFFFGGFFRLDFFKNRSKHRQTICVAVNSTAMISFG